MSYKVWGTLSLVTICLLITLLVPANVLSAPLAPDTLPAPQLLQPLDKTETTGNPKDPDSSRLLCRPLGIPCFQWLEVPAARRYQLQISEVPQDTALVLDMNQIEQTKYCPTAHDFERTSQGIKDGQTYYWRVRAYSYEEGSWGNWSTWWTFTRHWGIAPNLVQPEEDAVLYKPPLLKWTAVDGAEYYILQVSSDPDFPDDPSWPGFTYTYEPRNTAFALSTGAARDYKLPNDDTIYWRVRAVHSSNLRDALTRSGPWSNGGNGRKFSYCWSCNLDSKLGAGNDRRPLPLTPVNNEDHINSAYFSWTPVEGVAYYVLEMNQTSSFQQDPSSNVLGFFDDIINTGFLVKELKSDGDWDYLTSLNQIFWRVRAVNYYEVAGEWNNESPNASASFRPEKATHPSYPGIPYAVAPDLLYPEFYYDPLYSNLEPGQSVVLPTTLRWEDRTAAIPTFMWNQIQGAMTYTVQVADNKFFSPVAWELTTENLSATPTSLEPFSDPGIYYWRVNAGDGAWSQIWQTRIDQNRYVYTPTVAPPGLVQPTCQQEGDGLIYGQQILEHFPHLEWVPVNGVDHYEVQIATSSDFGDSVVETTATELTNYTPVKRYPPDTYYWRVRALNSINEPMGSGDGWSWSYYFSLVRQFSPEPIYSDAEQKLNQPFSQEALLTADLLGDHSGHNGYDLTALYTAMDNSYWYFGWAIRQSGSPVRFQLYLDTDGAHNSGMDSSPYPDGNALPDTGDPYRPENVLQWDMFGASGMPTVTLFSKLGANWDYASLLDKLGYAVFTTTQIYSDTAGFVMLAVPQTAIGSPATVNAHLVSVDASSDTIIDTVDRGYVAVTSAPTPRTPPNMHLLEDRTVIYPRMPLMTWHTMEDIRNVRYQSSTDDTFSQIEEGEEPNGQIPLIMSFSDSNPYYLTADVYADNVYFWRLQSRYPDPWAITSSWSKNILESNWSRAIRFSKRAQVPTNLSPSTGEFVKSTPTFSWSPVQGAARYHFELEGGGYSFSEDEMVNNIFVPEDAIPNGDYVWRVRMYDGTDTGNMSQDNYAEGRFTKGSDVPSLVFPLRTDSFTDTAYFRWSVLPGASYYNLEVASDNNFSVNYQLYKEINNTMYVPESKPKAVVAGPFTWRVCGYNGSEEFMGCEQYLISTIYLPVVIRF
ncbi:MAG: hypothetical protein JW981_02025 [Anaerolineae bacterium]|nr:hypothetical protein [Anaerolineae bacterium]